jgi:hypothetical protein
VFSDAAARLGSPDVLAIPPMMAEMRIMAIVQVRGGKLDPAGLPVDGAETARKLPYKALRSDEVMRNWASSEGSRCKVAA